MSFRRGIAVVSCSVAVLSVPVIARAQSITVGARAGHCQITVSGSPATSAKLVVQRNSVTKFKKTVGKDDLPRTIKLSEPIGTTTGILVSFDGKPVNVTIAEANGTADGCGDVEEDGEVFTANGYVGMSIDTFAAEDLQNYLNPNESGNSTLHDNAGVNFEYRMFRQRSFSLWVSGETLHNVKSTSIDCKENPDLEKCKSLTGLTTNLDQKFLAILRDASSVEANVALRLHFINLNADSTSPAEVYFQAKLGYVTVAKSDADAAEYRTYSLGVMAMGGPMAGSYIDVGYGRSDVYKIAPRRRFKVEGLVSLELPHTTMRPYLQMVVDADRGDGPDSIQTFIGLDFDLKDLRGIFFK